MGGMSAGGETSDAGAAMTGLERRRGGEGGICGGLGGVQLEMKGVGVTGGGGGGGVAVAAYQDRAERYWLVLYESFGECVCVLCCQMQ